MQNKLNLFEYIRGKPFLSLVAGAALLSIGIFLSDIPAMIGSQNWPSTEGTITLRRFVGSQFEEYDGDLYQNINGYIHYQYSVNGESYTSSAVNAIDSLYHPSSIINKYPKGKDIIIYYNPQKPSQALLEPGFVVTFKVFGLSSSVLVWGGSSSSP